MIDLTIAKQDESYAGDGVRFVIDPVELYPMMFDHLAKMKKSDAPTASPLRDYHSQLVTLSDDALIALPPQPYHPDRNAMLELARLWFTEVLHTAAGGGPMSIHLTPARPEFKLTSVVSDNNATPFFGVKEGGE